MEKVYENALRLELAAIGLYVRQQIPVPVYYKGIQVGDYIADLMVDNILVELKAVEKLLPIHEAQVVNYLTATKIDIGLLINFGKSVEVKRKYRERKHSANSVNSV